MKKVPFFAAALLALAACAKVELQDNYTPKPIVFNSPVVGTPTKGAMTTYDYDPAVGFDVYALFSNADPAPTSLAAWADATEANDSEYLSGKAFTQQGTSPNWYFGNTGAFWPKQTNASLTFHAISPTGLGNGVSHVWKGGEYTGFKVTDFVVDDNETTINASNQRDLMFSSIAFGKKQADEGTDQNGTVNPDAGGGNGNGANPYQKYKGVDILFHHALACIQFKAKLAVEDVANVKYRIESITITGHTVNGTVEENLDVTGKDYSTTANDLANVVNISHYFTNWGPAASPSTVSVAKVLHSVANYATAATDLSTAALDLTSSSPYLVIPQTLGNGVTVTVKYWEKIGNLTEVEITPDPIQLNTLKIVSTETPVSTWQANHRYTYTIIIGRDEIKLDPAVSAWEDTNVSGPAI